jgi:tripartite-type tricarboxylate transporter receptor subunit TctC
MRHCATATLRHLAGIAIGCLILAAAMPVWAQPYPSRPIRFVVPFPPGTSTDVAARLVAQRLAERFGQQVVVDNRAGASGTIGIAIVAQAAPNGYTWALGTTTTHALAPLLGAKLGYDPVRDFTPVALLGDAAYFLTTYPAVPATTVQAFVAYARANPGKLHYASVGNASLGHLTGELLKKAAGIDMVHVPYKGSTLSTIDLMAGRIQLQITTIPASLPHVRAGKLRALAVTSRERVSTLRETPTVAESGFPGFHASLWMGVFIPARTGAAVTAFLDREFSSTLGATTLREALVEQGFEPGKLTPIAFSGLIREDTARWRKVIEEAGIKPE